MGEGEREGERGRERERERGRGRERETERYGLKTDSKQVPCGNGEKDFEKKGKSA